VEVRPVAVAAGEGVDLLTCGAWAQAAGAVSMLQAAPRTSHVRSALGICSSAHLLGHCAKELKVCRRFAR
jgi:hypothetical protein